MIRPMDVSRIASTTFVGEVVMRAENDSFPGGRTGTWLPRPDWDRHAVRADPGLIISNTSSSRRRQRTRCATSRRSNYRVSRAVTTAKGAECASVARRQELVTDGFAILSVTAPIFVLMAIGYLAVRSWLLSKI